MLGKRLIAVVTVRNHWAVQSFAYQRYLPLGKPECIIENMDRWGADEILIQDISRSHLGAGPNMALIEKIRQLHCSTPLTYAGGIDSAASAIAVIQGGVERICIDQLLHQNPNQVYEIAAALGSQALVASIPLGVRSDQSIETIEWYDYQKNSYRPMSDEVLQLFADNIISEAIIIDHINEGQRNRFQFKLLDYFTDNFANKRINIKIPLIPFGGLSEYGQLEHAFLDKRVSAVAIGNFLNYREHQIQHYKQQLNTLPIRSPHYHGAYW